MYYSGDCCHNVMGTFMPVDFPGTHLCLYHSNQKSLKKKPKNLFILNQAYKNVILTHDSFFLNDKINTSSTIKQIAWKQPTDCILDIYDKFREYKRALNYKNEIREGGRRKRRRIKRGSREGVTGEAVTQERQESIFLSAPAWLWLYQEN